MAACDDREGFYLERKEKRQQDAEESGGDDHHGESKVSVVAVARWLRGSGTGRSACATG
jgi:hypothetical protein